ncbi:hypothetical protein DFH09DRAFT_1338868 [Mycena vulgaris]|nr:hypothetical protein DFH09DRAFT_1338868 [Mycena vulgaris]
MECSNLSNPDVTGIGVRAAIYAQNLTCFLPVIVHLWDRKISKDELKGIKDQSIGMLAVAFAILLTTITLAKGAGGDKTITSYNAAVVLDLSWMNNTSTWIWFILYVHYQSKRDDRPPIKANWSEWRDALLEPLRELLGQNMGARGSTRTSIGIWGITQRIWRIAQRIWRFISEQPVLTLGSIHLSLMAAVGIWLWSDPSKFGHPLDPSCDPMLTVVGIPARFSSKPLRIASLTMYSLILIPGLNLIPPFVFFLTLHISYNWCRRWYQSPSLDVVPRPFPATQDINRPNSPSTSNHGAQPQPSDSSSSLLSSDIELQSRRSSVVSGTVTQPRTAPDTEQGGPSRRSSAAVSSGVALVVGLVSLVAINVLFIVDIELTLRRNKGDQNGDDQWGFGQVLALLLLIIPLRDAWGALQDIWEKLEGVQEQFNEILRRECLATSVQVVEELERLVKNGADPKATVHLAGTTFGNYSQLVTSYGKTELAQFLRTLITEQCYDLRQQKAMSSP